MAYFNLNAVHPSWQAAIQNALNAMDPTYLKHLYQTQSWLPGHNQIFNAFSLPVDRIHYILFGESPYPRAQSANGFAFWDAAVKELWVESGLSKPVNRATSLRNFIKMLLVAEGVLNPTKTTQAHIAQVDKKPFVKTNTDLFNNLLKHGFLLLNASLILQETSVTKDAKAWQPFMANLLEFLYQQRPHCCTILFGNIANKIEKLIKHPHVKKLYSEHPYNHTFITNPTVIEFFNPLYLLRI